MPLVRKSRNLRKRAIPATLPLFDFADQQRLRALPRSVRRLARRWHLSPAHAIALAEQLGYSLEDER